MDVGRWFDHLEGEQAGRLPCYRMPASHLASWPCRNQGDLGPRGSTTAASSDPSPAGVSAHGPLFCLDSLDGREYFAVGGIFPGGRQPYRYARSPSPPRGLAMPAPWASAPARAGLVSVRGATPRNRTNRRRSPVQCCTNFQAICVLGCGPPRSVPTPGGKPSPCPRLGGRRSHSNVWSGRPRLCSSEIVTPRKEFGGRRDVVNATREGRGEDRSERDDAFRTHSPHYLYRDGQWVVRGDADSTETAELERLKADPYGRQRLIRWPGLLGDLAIWIATCGGVPPLFVHAVVAWRRRRRARAGLCLVCGYDLRASREFGRCPECGSACTCSAES